MIALALDADRTYRIAFIEDALGQPIGTSRPAAFDQAARAVVRAMRDGDCDAFLTLVSRTDGLGVGPDEEVCRRVSDAPFRRELVGNQGVRPVALGGNTEVAFYKLRTRPDAYYTMVMGRGAARPGGPRVTCSSPCCRRTEPERALQREHLRRGGAHAGAKGPVASGAGEQALRDRAERAVAGHEDEVGPREQRALRRRLDRSCGSSPPRPPSSR